MKKYLTKYEVRWAIIFSFITLLWTAYEYEMGWHDTHIDNHRYFTFFFLIPATLCYILFILDKKANRFKKRFKFKHAFLSGLMLTFFIFLFSIPTQLIIHYLVTPDFVANIREYVVLNGEIDRNDASTLFQISNFIFIFPILYLLYGLFLSVILGLIFKKKSKRNRRRIR